MGLSASQGRLLLLTAKKSDLEFRAQQIAMLRAILCQQQEEASKEYEDATSNRVMKMTLGAVAGKNNSGESQNVTWNLTYRNLISGTLLYGPSDPMLAGIVSSNDTAPGDYASNHAYRLMTNDGAIVVSDKNEIPKVSNSIVESKTKKSDAGYYEITNAKSDGSVATSFGVVPAADSDLAKLLEGDEESKGGFEFDISNSLLRYTDSEGNEKMYDLTGKEVTAQDNISYKFDKTATIYKTEDLVPKSKQYTEDNGYTIIGPGADGICTLCEYVKDANGEIKTDANGNPMTRPIQRYLIDPGLKEGYYDNKSGFSDINYLQDCLRNGKYTLQKCVKDENVDAGWRWSDISWDTASNVTDSYYADDDAAAKAKYDRIQNQIQAQDKKLELELDNIETQRSAVTTEIESVEKVINDNIEGSFNAFG